MDRPPVRSTGSPGWTGSIPTSGPLEFRLTESGEAPSALRMAVALSWYWLTRGVFSEGRHWLDQALTRDTSLTVERSRALCVDSVLAGFRATSLPYRPWCNKGVSSPRSWAAPPRAPRPCSPPDS